jgi:hypothetical protein
MSYQRRVYGKHASSIKEQHEKVARREVVVGDIRIATHKFLATASFAIHVAMQ